MICFAISLRDADSMDPWFSGLHPIYDCIAMSFAFIDLLQVELVIVVQEKQNEVFKNWQCALDRKLPFSNPEDIKYAS